MTPPTPLAIDRAIRWTTTAAVVAVAGVAAVISYRHAYAVVTAHGESGLTAALGPLTVDGLIYACSMVMLQAARRGRRAPLLAYALLALGIVATLAANVAHGLGSGPVGAIVGAWPAVALVGSYELLMTLVRTTADQADEAAAQAAEAAAQAEVDPLQEAASAYLQSVEEGQPLSERALAAMFNESRRWARKAKALAEESPAAAAAA